jgi:hypothetical protein
LSPKGNTLDDFFNAVRSSVNDHAKRKNYTDDGADGDNKLLIVMSALGIHTPHAIGEIVYKCAEYLRCPRRVILEKIAGWAFVIWRENRE